MIQKFDEKPEGSTARYALANGCFREKVFAFWAWSNEAKTQQEEAST